MRKIYFALVLILCFSDANAQWASLNSGVTENLNSVFASIDMNTVWVAGNNGTYLKTINGGTSWSSLNFGTDQYDVFFLPDNLHGWIGGGGGIRYTTNGGTSWTNVPIADNIYAVHFFDDLNGLGVGLGKIYSSVNGGISWTSVAVGNATTQYADIKFGADANTAWVVGTLGADPKIYKLTRAGGVWTPILQYTATGTGSLYALAVINNSTAWAVGEAPNFLKTTDGNTWISANLNSNGNALYGMDATSPTKVIGVGNASMYYTIDGSTWFSENDGTNELIFDISIVGAVGYAVGSNGIIIKTTNSVLPVTLSYFTAQSQNKKVHLNWSTSMELNNTGFAIMRKATTTNNWEQVGFVRSFGNSNKTQSYSFTDEPKGGDVFLYQLKQIDIDSKSSLTNILKVKLEIDDASLVVYPNPFKGQTTINYSVPTANKVQLVIRNQFGEIVKTVVNAKQQTGNYAVTVNANELASGSYYAELRVGENKKTVKLNLIR